MGYDTTHMRVALEVPGPVPMKIFAYDTVDSLATIYAAGYVSDAKRHGMQKGDIVLVRRWTTSIPAAKSELITPAGSANILVTFTIHFVLGINATTGAADLTDGLAITATNT